MDEMMIKRFRNNHKSEKMLYVLEDGNITIHHRKLDLLLGLDVVGPKDQLLRWNGLTLMYK